MNKLSGSIAAPAAMSGLIWLLISVLTDAPVAFVIVGAVLCGLMAFVVGTAIRHIALGL